VTTRRALGGKRGHCSVGAVHGGESDDPILALMRHFNLPVTREDGIIDHMNARIGT
jgi:hypothetical protein